MTKFTKNDLAIIDPNTGNDYGMLNPHLVEKQNLTLEEVKKLIELHLLLQDTYTLMETEDDVETLRDLATLCAEIEYNQQKNWHFPQDSNYHNWYRVPKCTCPKLDNEDRKGTPYKVFSGDCPIHHFGGK